MSNNPTDSIDQKMYYFDYDEGGLLSVFFAPHDMTTAECIKRTAKTIQAARTEGYERGKLDGHAAQHAKDLSEETWAEDDTVDVEGIE